LNLKAPESRISKELVLPHGRGKTPKICLISNSIQYENRLTQAEMDALARDKKSAKRITREYDFFMSEPSMMVAVGKSLGRYLGPVGKMPSIIPPGANIEKFVEMKSKSVKLRIKDSPVIHCVVGAEDMQDSDVSENINHVIDEIKKILPGKGKVKSAYIKLTMGKAMKIDIASYQ